MKRSYKLAFATIVVFVAVFSCPAGSETVAPLHNRWLTVSVRQSDGSLELRAVGLRDPVLTARVGAEVNHQWIWSTDYTNHQIVESTFQSPLGEGHQLEVLFPGLAGKPNLK